MSFCGLGKKKKKNKDDPPYTPTKSSIEENTGEKARNKELTDTLRRTEEEVKELRNELDQERKYGDRKKRETEDLKKELALEKEKITKVEAEKLKTVNAPDENVEAYTIQIENIQSQVEEEKKTKQAIEAEKGQLSEELQSIKKTLEDSKTEYEAKLAKLSEDLNAAKQQEASEKGLRTKAEEDCGRLKREKDSLENKLAITSRELEIAKKESHIPRSPTRAPSDEWKAKIETAEAALQKERDQRLEKERENSRLSSTNVLLISEKEELEKKIHDQKARTQEEIDNMKKNLEMNYKNDCKRLEDMVSDYKRRLADTEAAKEKLLTRLSSQTAAQVLDNNPNVSDLSDPNRPQKLSEKLSQVYDDEWTDATEELEKLDKNEEEILKILLDLLVYIYEHCKEAAENQMSRIEEDLFLPPLESSSASSLDTNGTEQLKSPTSTKTSMSKIPRFTSHKGRPALPNISTEKKTVDNDNSGARDKDKPKRSLSASKVKGEKVAEVPVEVRKGIKEYRKKVTKHVWPVIEKEVTSKLRKREEFGDNVIEACKRFITKCVEICWLMRVQDPPVALSWTVPEDRHFNTDIYRAYTKSGSHVEYVVWPTMYLYEGGPILMKGVAQGTGH